MGRFENFFRFTRHHFFGSFLKSIIMPFSLDKAADEWARAYPSAFQAQCADVSSERELYVSEPSSRRLKTEGTTSLVTAGLVAASMIVGGFFLYQLTRRWRKARRKPEPAQLSEIV